MAAVGCTLIPCDETLPPITLPNEKEMFIGRSKKTNIKNAYCSRRQLSVIAAYDTSEVTVKHVGLKPSFLNGRRMKKNKLYLAKNGAVVEVMLGQYKYVVKFHYSHASSSRSKRSREDECENVRKHRKVSENVWEELFENSLLVFTSSGFRDKRKVAAFDLDGTLIKTESGDNFPRDSDDWMLWDSRVKSSLIELSNAGYMIIVFANQSSLCPKHGHHRSPGFKNKIEEMASELIVPIKVFVSTSHGYFRKPAPGMWNFMEEKCRVPVDIEESVYVGDCAGRPDDWKLGEICDFSMSDRLFAMNINIQFYTPEEFFLNEASAPFVSIPFAPMELNLTVEPNYGIPSARQEVILLIGAPASGKNFFVSQKLIPKEYINVYCDNFGSCEKCIEDLENTLENGKSVVILFTRPYASSRKTYIDICKKLRVSVRCFVMGCDLQRALHNNIYRKAMDQKRHLIKPRRIERFYSHFESPELKEGFSDIIYVPFIPQFKNKQEKSIYMTYLVPK